MTLYDSDVLIWYVRGHEGAISLLEQDSAPVWPVVALMEVFRGARDKQEPAFLKREIGSIPATILYLTPSISTQALEVCSAYGLQVALSVADCLIAATALEHDIPLVTGNVKHYRAIRGLKLQAFVA